MSDTTTTDPGTITVDADRLHTALQFAASFVSDDLNRDLLRCVEFRFVDGVACFGRWGKHAGKSMAWVAKNAPDYYSKFILGVDSSFSPEVKKLALDALAGKFPETI